MYSMKSKFMLVAAALALALPGAAQAQMRPLNDPVVAHPDPESLFTSPDPVLHRNKQAALGIIKVLLEAGQWDRAGEFLTDRYIQHNPLASSGLDAVVHYFTNVARVQPKPVLEKTAYPIVAVQAEGDYVTILVRRELPVPGIEGETYTTTWFDTWRFVDGKADQHWDPATLPAVPASPPPGERG
jgi:predicted SnoaL-like aldol condensation-catalyzing enzyme